MNAEGARKVEGCHDVASLKSLEVRYSGGAAVVRAEVD
jgi:hypothetical protein